MFVCGGGKTATDKYLIVYSPCATGYANNLLIQNNGDTTIRGSLSVGGNIKLYGTLLLYTNTTIGSSGTFSTDGYVMCNMYSISNPGTDLLGTYNVATSNSNNPQNMIYILFNTFTRFHIILQKI
jgi:hypothetical protein